MLKQSMFVLIAAGVISIGTPSAKAQDSSPAGDQQSAAPQEHGRWHHGPPDPAERTKELTKKLNLTSDQQTKVQEALQAERSQMESLRQNGSTPQSDRRAKMMEIHKGTDAQVRAVLDSNQQKKWDEMQANREKWMQKRGQGSPDAGSDQNTPPQQ